MPSACRKLKLRVRDLTAALAQREANLSELEADLQTEKARAHEVTDALSRREAAISQLEAEAKAAIEKIAAQEDEGRQNAERLSQTEIKVRDLTAALAQREANLSELEADLQTEKAPAPMK